MDYIGVKRFDEQGRVIGERRLLGLLTGRAYKAGVADVPIVRRKARRVLQRAALPPGGHDEKALLEILDTYPRDELFQIDEDTLFDHAIGILGLGERQFVRVFARRDEFERFVSFLVYLPRERFHTENRVKIQEILRDAVDGTGTDFDLRLTESVLVRLHIVITTEPGEVPEPDVWEIEERISEATRSWTDDLRLALRGGPGGRGADDWRRFATAFPVVYRADNPVAQAVRDIRSIDDLYRTGGLDVRLYRSVDGLRCRVLTWKAALELSDIVPILEHMGVRVADERPYEITPVDAPVTHISDFGLRRDGEGELGDDVRAAFEDVLWRALTGRLASDPINGLILGAGLEWRDTVVLRAVTRYLRQAGTTFSDRYLDDDAARASRRRGGCSSRCSRRASIPTTADAGARRSVDAADRVAAHRRGREPRRGPHPAQLPRRHPRDRCAPTTTSATPTARRPCSRSSSTPRAIPQLPQPRPLFEIFVLLAARRRACTCAAARSRAAGCAGRIAARTSAPRSSGLMKAQMVKNAVIVPVGAKGGFVVKRPPATRGAARARSSPATARSSAALLDLTDNLVDGEVVPPARRRALRRRRSVPRRRGRQGHRDVLRHRQRDRGASTASGSATRSPPAARPATTTRRWASPRAARGSR